jgi:hypothetical protein
MRTLQTVRPWTKVRAIGADDTEWILKIPRVIGETGPVGVIANAKMPNKTFPRPAGPYHSGMAIMLGS